MKIIYRYISSTFIKEFKSFDEMRNFAKDEKHNGRYHIITPLRHTSFRREQIVCWTSEEDYKKYMETCK